MMVRSFNNGGRREKSITWEVKARDFLCGDILGGDALDLGRLAGWAYILGGRGFSNNLDCGGIDGVETLDGKFGESDIDGRAEHGGGSEEREKASVGSDTKRSGYGKFVGRGGDVGFAAEG